MHMEREIVTWLEDNGYHHLGLYNMSVQTDSPDGTHGSMGTNLLKVMMALNWFRALEPSNVLG